MVKEWVEDRTTVRVELVDRGQQHRADHEHANRARDREQSDDDPVPGDGLRPRCSHEWTLTVVSWQVVETADGWFAVEGGVAAVMVVGVQPSVKRIGALQV